MKISLALGAILFATAPLAAPSSFVLPHEGRLLDGQDNPVNGTLAMTFGIFDSFEPGGLRSWPGSTRPSTFR